MRQTATDFVLAEMMVEQLRMDSDSSDRFRDLRGPPHEAAKPAEKCEACETQIRSDGRRGSKSVLLEPNHGSNDVREAEQSQCIGAPYAQSFSEHSVCCVL